MLPASTGLLHGRCVACCTCSVPPELGRCWRGPRVGGGSSGGWGRYCKLQLVEPSGLPAAPVERNWSLAAQLLPRRARGVGGCPGGMGGACQRIGPSSARQALQGACGNAKRYDRLPRAWGFSGHRLTRFCSPPPGSTAARRGRWLHHRSWTSWLGAGEGRKCNWHRS